MYTVQALRVYIVVGLTPGLLPQDWASHGLPSPVADGSVGEILRKACC